MKDDSGEHWISMRSITTAFGLTPRAIRRAVRNGLLQNGVHVRETLSGSYLLNGRKILPLIPEIRLGMTKSWKEEALYRSLRNKTYVVSTQQKKKLSQAIMEAELLLDTLCRQLGDTARVKADLEREYKITLWERKDCPYCEGSGRIVNVACLSCSETATQEACTTPIGCSTLDYLPVHVLRSLRDESARRIKSGGNADLRWIIEQYDEALSKRMVKRAPTKEGLDIILRSLSPFKESELTKME